MERSWSGALDLNGDWAGLALYSTICADNDRGGGDLSLLCIQYSISMYIDPKGTLSAGLGGAPLAFFSIAV